MTFEKSAYEIGKSNNYFYSLKRTNPTVFRLVRFLGKGDLVEGYYKLLEYQENLQSQVEKIYFTFEKQIHFAEALAEKGIFKNQSTANSVLQNLFSVKEGFMYERVARNKRIVKAFRERLK